MKPHPRIAFTAHGSTRLEALELMCRIADALIPPGTALRDFGHVYAAKNDHGTWDAYVDMGLAETTTVTAPAAEPAPAEPALYTVPGDWIRDTCPSPCSLACQDAWRARGADATDCQHLRDCDRRLEYAADEAAEGLR